MDPLFSRQWRYLKHRRPRAISNQPSDSGYNGWIHFSVVNGDISNTGDQERSPISPAILVTTDGSTFQSSMEISQTQETKSDLQSAQRFWLQRMDPLFSRQWRYLKHRRPRAISN